MHNCSLSEIFNRLISTFPSRDRTIPTMLQRRAEAGDADTLLVIGGARYSGGALAARAGGTAAMLQAAGVRAGDRVVILCGNRIEFFDLLLGCAWLDAVAVPVNLAVRGMQLRHILANSGAEIVITEEAALPAFAHIERLGLGVRHLWVIPEGSDAAPRDVGDWAATPLPPGGHPIAPVAVNPSSTATIIYTSGTTGPSKGVCCPQAQYFWWGVHTIDVLEIGADDVLLTTLPLFHVNALGSFFQAMLSGATLVVLDRFSASGFSRSLVEHGATVTYLLGAMVSILLATTESDLDRSHKVVRALAPGVPSRFRDTFTERFGMALIDGYGSTETNFVIGDRVGETSSGMGRVRPAFEAKVVDEHDEEVGRGTPGELVIRGHDPFSIATGYHGMPENTVEAWRNLWFHTGDRVVQDAAGSFVFLDRIKDAIRRRGENISAFEVEQVLLSHPAVATAAVFAVPSELGEDEVMAALILHDGTALTPEALLDFCQPRMAYFSVPRFLLFVDSLPLTENGKIKKFALRDLGVTPATWDREAAGYKVARQRVLARA